MAAVDLHVAVSLFRICGSYCKLVHLARTTPPSLSYDSLKFFDEVVRHCFSNYVAVDTDNAQLSWVADLSHASFISLASSGFGSASYHHLVSAISEFNALVSSSDVTTVEFALSSPLSQHALSKKFG